MIAAAGNDLVWTKPGGEMEENAKMRSLHQFVLPLKI